MNAQQKSHFYDQMALSARIAADVEMEFARTRRHLSWYDGRHDRALKIHIEVLQSAGLASCLCERCMKQKARVA